MKAAELRAMLADLPDDTVVMAGVDGDAAGWLSASGAWVRRTDDGCTLVIVVRQPSRRATPSCMDPR